MGRQHHVLTTQQRSLVLPGDVARCLFAARGRLASGRAHAHWTRPHCLEQALTLRQPTPGLIIHMDRGSQYTSLTRRTRIG
jgi:hypothetical protein